MTKSNYDNTCKYLAEEYPSDFASWILGIPTNSISVLKTELSVEPIRADSVTFLRTANQILHLEFQTLTQSNPEIPFRMLDYSTRLKRKYQCRVVQVVVFLQKTTNEIAFTEEYRDDTTVHGYRVIRLWEQDPTLFVNNPALLPLAPLTRTNSPQGLLARVAERIATIDDSTQRQNLSSCTQILAGLRFNTDLIRQYLQEETMRESVIYQDIWEKATREATHSLVIRQLNRRFGEIDKSLLSQVQGLSNERVEAKGEALLDFSSIDDLVAWLQNSSNN